MVFNIIKQFYLILRVLILKKLFHFWFIELLFFYFLLILKFHFHFNHNFIFLFPLMSSFLALSFIIFLLFFLINHQQTVNHLLIPRLHYNYFILHFQNQNSHFHRNPHYSHNLIYFNRLHLNCLFQNYHLKVYHHQVRNFHHILIFISFHHFSFFLFFIRLILYSFSLIQPLSL